MTQPPKSTDELLESLETNTFTTYKSRINAYERLQARNWAWNATLIATSVATTIASVGLLVDGNMYGASGPVFLAACAIIALAASLVVSSVDYSARVTKMELNYKELQSLSLKVQAARAVTPDDPKLLKRLSKEYHVLRTHSENHTTADWQRYLKNRSLARFKSSVVSVVPYVTLLLPAWICFRFAVWVVRGN